MSAITPADDRRHTPGPGARPLWNESWWFPFYDPATDVGVVTRIGLLPLQGTANVWFFVTRGGRVVHDATNLALPVPPGDIDGGISVGGVTYQCLAPLERWRLRYAGGDVAMDVEWRAFSPAHPWPVPPGTAVDDVQRHLEQSGWVSGTLRLGSERVTIDRAFGHRDHSWGGERDWAKLQRWFYTSGEMGADLSFNAVKVWLAPDAFLTVGCLWDGRDSIDVASLDVDGDIDAQTGDHTGARVTMRDARGRDWRFDGRVLAHCPVQIGPTRVDDGVTEFRGGDRVGYGIIEYGRQTG
jgi:hypothetical protein